MYVLLRNFPLVVAQEEYLLLVHAWLVLRVKPDWPARRSDVSFASPDVS